MFAQQIRVYVQKVNSCLLPVPVNRVSSSCLLHISVHKVSSCLLSVPVKRVSSCLLPVYKVRYLGPCNRVSSCLLPVYKVGPCFVLATGHHAEGFIGKHPCQHTSRFSKESAPSSRENWHVFFFIFVLLFSTWIAISIFSILYLHVVNRWPPTFKVTQSLDIFYLYHSQKSCGTEFFYE